MDNTYRIVMLVLLAYSAYTDIKCREIMMIPVYACMLVGLLGPIAYGSEWKGIVYGAIPGVLMLAFSFISRGSVGEGDAYLFIVLGMLTGIRMTLDVMVVSSLTAALYSGINLLTGRLKKKDCIAFVPFVLTGYIGALIVA